MKHRFEELVSLARTGAAAFGTTPREECVAAARAYLAEQRSAIRDKHREGESGRNVLHLLSDMTDTVVRGVTEFGLYHARNRGALLSRAALCALGGYGRRELSPCSDLDVCLLFDKHLDADTEALNHFLVPFLWDIGFKAGYATQGVEEAVRLTESDPMVLTTYAQARLLMGDSTTFARLRLLLAERWAGDTQEVIAFLRRREVSQNLPDAHRDLYAAEPNLKESVGGLRDYHTALWLILLTNGPTTLEDLERAGHISAEEHLEMAEGLDFLWRIRNEMHFHTGKPDDQLSYAMQRHVCRALGYGGNGQQALGRFMQDYYTAARRTHRFLQTAARICDHQTEIFIPEGDGPERAGITTVEGRITAGTNDPHWFEENPPRLMEVFWECARRGLPLSPATQQLVRRNLGLVTDAFRANDLVRRFFLAICSRPLRAGFALREAAQTGLLAAYLPEFAQIQDIVRYADFHSYPVDEHTLRCIEALAEIPRMEGPVGRSLERQLENLRDPRILVLSVLFHDLGKAGGEEHTEAGVQLARGIAERIGLPEEDTDRVCFLVRHHMNMSNIAFYRDTDDAALVRDFADTMRSDNRLRALLLLTYADLKGVGPNVWTEWKGALLLKLYLKAERMLSGRAQGDHENYWETPKAGEAARLASPAMQDRMIDYLKAMGERYFHAFSAEHIARDLDTVEEARGTGLAVRHTVLQATAVSEVVVCTRDRHGLFAELAGSFASELVDVQDAALFTTPDGFAVDCFTVADAAQSRPLTSRQMDSIVRVIRALIFEGENIQKRVDASRRRLFALLQPRVHVPPRVWFDNEASSTDTIVEMEAGDRTGLLYDMVRVLTDAGVDIQSAHIMTDATQVRDAFYIRLNGRKLEDGALEAIRAEAERVLDPMALVEQ